MRRSFLNVVAVPAICLGVCFLGFGCWAFIRGEVFEATCRVKMELPHPLNRETNSASWNPYPVQDQIELIRSDAVLSNAIERLWMWCSSTNYRTELFGPDKRCEVLRNMMSVSPFRGTTYLDIRIRGTSRSKVAVIANCVGEAYCSTQIADWREGEMKRTEVIRNSLTENINQAHATSRKMRYLRDALSMSANEEAGWSNRLSLPTNSPDRDSRVIDLRAYDEARREFAEISEAFWVIEKAIANGPRDCYLSKFYVTNENRAKMPLGPIFPRRSLALVSWLAGLVLTGTGWLMLRRIK